MKKETKNVNRQPRVLEARELMSATGGKLGCGCGYSPPSIVNGLVAPRPTRPQPSILNGIVAPRPTRPQPSIINGIVAPRPTKG
jgi:hypothetical protein